MNKLMLILPLTMGRELTEVYNNKNTWDWHYKVDNRARAARPY